MWMLSIFRWFPSSYWTQVCYSNKSHNTNSQFWKYLLCGLSLHYHYFLFFGVTYFHRFTFFHLHWAIGDPNLSSQLNCGVKIIMMLHVQNMLAKTCELSLSVNQKVLCQLPWNQSSQGLQILAISHQLSHIHLQKYVTF